MNPPKSLREHISSADSSMWRSVKDYVHSRTRAELPDSVYMDVYIEVFRPIVRIIPSVNNYISNYMTHENL